MRLVAVRVALGVTFLAVCFVIPHALLVRLAQSLTNLHCLRGIVPAAVPIALPARKIDVHGKQHGLCWSHGLLAPRAAIRAAGQQQDQEVFHVVSACNCAADSA